MLVVALSLGAVGLMRTNLRFLLAPALLLTILWTLGFFVHGPNPEGRWYRW